MQAKTNVSVAGKIPRVLPAGLPRVEVGTYTWSDDETSVCITVPVPELISKEQVMHAANYHWVSR